MFCGPRGVWRRPHGFDSSQRFSRFELAAARAVGADKLGVAEAAHGIRPVRFARRPQVAAGEAQEHGRPIAVGAFALQRVEHFLDCVAHGDHAELMVIMGDE